MQGSFVGQEGPEQGTGALVLPACRMPASIMQRGLLGSIMRSMGKGQMRTRAVSCVFESFIFCAILSIDQYALFKLTDTEETDQRTKLTYGFMLKKEA